jgi:enoyl-CoA hydratase
MSDIEFSVTSGVALLRLNRPAKLNTVTSSMAADLTQYASECRQNEDIRVVVLTGAGDKAFCAGSDVKELDVYDSPWAFRNRDDYCDTIRAIPKPVICAVNGYAFGGGLELCLNSDIRLASTNATFCAAEIKLGWIGGGGVTYLLTHNIGYSNAAKMLLSGEPIDATQALAWQLISEVHPAEELQDAAMSLAEMISERAPIAAQTAKSNLRAAYAMPLETAIAYEKDLQTVCMGTADAEEGRAAFKEKRAPQFRGR